MTKTPLEALKACADQFAFYAEEHRKAGKIEKAETNERFRDMARAALTAPVPVVINCPKCGEQHLDEGEWATRPHKTHQCQSCGHEWRPFPYATVGVKALTAPVGWALSEEQYDGVREIIRQAYLQGRTDNQFCAGDEERLSYEYTSSVTDDFLKLFPSVKPTSPQTPTPDPDTVTVRREDCELIGKALVQASIVSAQEGRFFEAVAIEGIHDRLSQALQVKP